MEASNQTRAENSIKLDSIPYPKNLFRPWHIPRSDPVELNPDEQRDAQGYRLQVIRLLRALPFN